MNTLVLIFLIAWLVPKGRAAQEFLTYTNKGGTVITNAEVVKHLTDGILVRIPGMVGLDKVLVPRPEPPTRQRESFLDQCLAAVDDSLPARKKSELYAALVELCEKEIVKVDSELNSLADRQFYADLNISVATKSKSDSLDYNRDHSIAVIEESKTLKRSEAIAAKRQTQLNYQSGNDQIESGDRYAKSKLTKSFSRAKTDLVIRRGEILEASIELRHLSQSWLTIAQKDARQAIADLKQTEK
jgi:hypothetical protein